MTVQQLADRLISNPDQKVTIRKKPRNIIGFAEFRSINLGEDNYFKINFNDHAFLLLVPNQQLMLFTEEPPSTYSEIPDEDIGNKKQLVFRGKKYKLDNAHDYQYVIRLIKGDWNSIEGEVKFSDYIPEDGSNELLSLGWIVRTGERADLNPKSLSMEEIELG